MIDGRFLRQINIFDFYKITSILRYVKVFYKNLTFYKIYVLMHPSFGASHKKLSYIEWGSILLLFIFLFLYMNTQKIQNVKGFTLVELIVVITILVILGTIAFLNLGGMSASARDSQRTSDLNQINTQIMTIQAKNGTSYTTMVSSGTANQLTNSSIGGQSGSTANYFAGDVNYTVLGIDKTKFQDPIDKVGYKMGATSLAGTAYEVAAKLEESKTALVMGTYRARATPATMNASGAISGGIITLTSGVGNFKLNDILKDPVTNNTGAVTGISSDLTKVTVSTLATATGFVLALPESAGLIAATGATTTAVTNGTTALPY